MAYKINIAKYYLPLVITLLLLHIILLLNSRFTLWPEMMVYPYLVNNGYILYRDIILPYPPLFIYLLSLFSKHFAYSLLSFQLATWFLILLLDLEILFLSFKIYKSKLISILSLTFFVPISVAFQINGLWFDLVQTPFLLASVYFFFSFSKNKTFRDLNIAFALVLAAAAIKQQALWLMLWYFLLLTLKFRNGIIKIILNLFPFAIFALLVFTSHMLLINSKGLMEEFLNWVIFFPLESSSLPGYVQMPSFKQLVIFFSLFLFFLATYLRNKTNIFFVTGFFSLVFAYPRFDYFHLIPALSILSLCVGQNLKNFRNLELTTKVASTIAIFFLAIFITRYFLQNNTIEIRFFESEMQQAAQSLKMISNKGQPIYIQNGPDQLLPLSGSLPPKPWADEFSWYLKYGDLENKVIESLSKSPPQYIVYKPYVEGSEFELGVYRPKNLADYIDKNYSEFFKLSDTLWLKKQI